MKFDEKYPIPEAYMILISDLHRDGKINEDEYKTLSAVIYHYMSLRYEFRDD